MKLLLLCWCSSILAVTSCCKVDGFLCVSDYRKTITCVLNITGNPVGQTNTTYSLKFIHLKKPISTISLCPLVVMNQSYSGVCKVSSELFRTNDKYDIELCQESGCHCLEKNFTPSMNIQPTAPRDVVVQEAPETLNITWISGYEDHRYLSGLLKYELLLQTSQRTESKILHPKPNEKSELIQRSRLKQNARYCIAVRSLAHHEDDYSGTWSKWSPEICWRNKAGEAVSQQENIFVTLTSFLGPVCVVVGVLLFVFYSSAARMKIKTLFHTPSPAPFFQPVYQQHKGNLQEWLSPKGKCVLTYNTEEIFTTDAVIVVPKPIMKDPLENRDFHSPAVTQMIFPQCQTSYVGLPTMHLAPSPLTMICPGDTSYTQLPCSVWGVGEVEVASSPPEDVFNMSHDDSGCSCKDLTESPECSLPSSPVDDRPPPCYHSDYCILNKTAEGVAPVLVSKGGRLNDPSEI